MTNDKDSAVTEEALCRGSWTLGTACRKCSRCSATRPSYLDSQPTQSDVLVAALVEASEGLKQDLLNRAEWDDDAKVVCAGAGAWSRFTTALAALQEQSK